MNTSEMIENLKYVIDALEFMEKMKYTHSCNDCGRAKECVIKPGWGHIVRINCVDWKDFKPMTERMEQGQKGKTAREADDAAKRLNDLIFDINPSEICRQIASDNLKKWCSVLQIEMKRAMVQLPCWGGKEE